jgi:hypothetical protein
MSGGILHQHVSLGKQIQDLADEFIHLEKQCTKKNGFGSSELNLILTLKQSAAEDLYVSCAHFPLLFQNTMNEFLLVSYRGIYHLPTENVYLFPKGLSPLTSLSRGDHVVASDIVLVESLIKRAVRVMDDCISTWRNEGGGEYTERVLCNERDRVKEYL